MKEILEKLFASCLGLSGIAGAVLFFLTMLETGILSMMILGGIVVFGVCAAFAWLMLQIWGGTNT